MPIHQTWQTCSLWSEDEPYWFWRSEVKVKVTIDIYGNKLVNKIETKPLCASPSNFPYKLARMDPIDYGGQRSKVKVTIEMHGNKLVNTIVTKPWCASSSNLADMLTMVRGWSLLILEVTGQRWRARWASFTNVGCAGMLGFALLYLLLLLSYEYIYLSGSKYWTFSTKFVFWGSIGKPRWPPRHLNCWASFDLSATLCTKFNETRQEARSSVEFVFYGTSRKPRWLPRPLIDCDIFDFSSGTAEGNLMKL